MRKMEANVVMSWELNKMLSCAAHICASVPPEWPSTAT